MTRAFSAGLIIAFCGVLIGGPHAVAQVPQITPEQLQRWQALPEAQKQQLLKQLGISQGSAPRIAAPAPGQRPVVSGPEVPIPAFVVPTEPRIQGGESLVVNATLKPGIEDEDVKAFMADSYRSRLIGSHFIQLNDFGVMEVPGIASIPLAGLSEKEIAIRLESEPLLAALDITVTILPLTPTGTAALELFGYRLFGSDTTDYYPGRDPGYPTGYGDTYGAVQGLGDVSGAAQGLGDLLGLGGFDQAPLPNMPVPRDYILGPGDTINVQLYGNENYEIQLVVKNDGTINFPQLGPKSVVGLTFGELKELIEQRIDEQLIGTEASITMGALRSIRVFVVGDVKRPGAYTMSSLARITNALFYAGGITEIGSLRRVQLKRGGNLVETLDLYDLLLNGDTSDDAQLRSDDVVFIPPVRTLVGIGGEVSRPAIYEL